MSTETLSIRIDSETKRKLELLAAQTQRSKSFLAAEALAAFIELESWLSQKLSVLRHFLRRPHR